MILDALRADQQGPAEIELDMEFAQRGRRGRHAVRGAAARGARRRLRPTSRARTWSRRAGGSSSRCSTHRLRCTPTRRARGARGGRQARGRVRRLAGPWVPATPAAGAVRARSTTPAPPSAAAQPPPGKIASPEQRVELGVEARRRRATRNSGRVAASAAGGARTTSRSSITTSDSPGVARQQLLQLAQHGCRQRGRVEAQRAAGCGRATALGGRAPRLR